MALFSPQLRTIIFATCLGAIYTIIDPLVQHGATMDRYSIEHREEFAPLYYRGQQSAAVLAALLVLIYGSRKLKSRLMCWIFATLLLVSGIMLITSPYIFEKTYEREERQMASSRVLMAFLPMQFVFLSSWYYLWAAVLFHHIAIGHIDVAIGLYGAFCTQALLYLSHGLDGMGPFGLSALFLVASIPLFFVVPLEPGPLAKGSDKTTVKHTGILSGTLLVVLITIISSAEAYFEESERFRTQGMDDVTLSSKLFWRTASTYALVVVYQLYSFSNKHPIYIRGPYVALLWFFIQLGKLIYLRNPYGGPWEPIVLDAISTIAKLVFVAGFQEAMLFYATSRYAQRVDLIYVPIAWIFHFMSLSMRIWSAVFAEVVRSMANEKYGPETMSIMAISASFFVLCMILLAYTCLYRARKSKAQ